MVVPERLEGLSAVERRDAMARISAAVEHHMVLRTSTDELAKHRSRRWLRDHGLAALVDGTL